jgi:hypothetical protein
MEVDAAPQEEEPSTSCSNEQKSAEDLKANLQPPPPLVKQTLASKSDADAPTTR